MSILFEVEQKFPLIDRAHFQDILAGRSIRLDCKFEQTDQYFAHPCRDFGKTDEALRIRVSNGATFLTYKGPKIDRATKTRREIELPLSSEPTAAGDFRTLLESLGFVPVLSVHKSRQSGTVLRPPFELHISLDTVAGLGDFVEIETMASADKLESARQMIALLADELKLVASERRSYLELLLAQA